MARTTVKAMLANVEHVGKPKLIANNTVRYTRPNGDTCVRLHRTDVVTRRADGSTVLTSGGWRTTTTKDRLRSYGPDGVTVFQRDHEWFICKRGDWDNAIPFEDGLVISADGEIAA